ncbi:MAG TPA: hypothetical protein GXZ26_08130 [Firmicutes bacterium]|jgi:foldase protein PrsA|nr:hypothetical protein [Bacillota bacterium]
MRWNPPRTKMKRRIAMGLVILIVISGLAVAYANVNFKDRSGRTPEVVATVAGEEITKDELTDLLLAQAGEQGLSILIAEKLVDLEAKKEKIVISEEEIEEELADYYEYYGGKEEFTQVLEKSPYSINEIKKNLAKDLTVKKLLTPRISVSEEEIKEYFEENKEEMTGDYEENKEKIADLLFAQKMQTEYASWIQELTQEYKVENFLAGK